MTTRNYTRSQFVKAKMVCAVLGLSLCASLAAGAETPRLDHFYQLKLRNEHNGAWFNRMEEWSLLLGALRACKSKGLPRRWSTDELPRWLLGSSIYPLQEYRTFGSFQSSYPSAEKFLTDYFRLTKRILRSATDSERRWDLRGDRPEIILTNLAGERKIAISAAGRFIEYETLLNMDGSRWKCDPCHPNNARLILDVDPMAKPRSTRFRPRV